MSQLNRAKIFAPFAALVGFDERVRRKEINYVAKHELDSDEEYEYFPETIVTDHYDNEVYQRVAVYVRVSTDDPRQTTSYELQKQYYEEFVINKRFHPPFSPSNNSYICWLYPNIVLISMVFLLIGIPCIYSIIFPVQKSSLIYAHTWIMGENYAILHLR